MEYLVKLKTLKIQGNKIDKSKNVNPIDKSKFIKIK